MRASGSFAVVASIVLFSSKCTMAATTIPVRVTNFADIPTDQVMLSWSIAAAIAAIIAAFVSIATLIYAVREFNMLLRKPKLRLTFSPDNNVFTSQCQVSVQAVRIDPGEIWHDHRWTVQVSLTVHNAGEATAADALIRLALPTEYVMNLPFDGTARPIAGGPEYMVVSLQEELPIYPGIPRLVTQPLIFTRNIGRLQTPEPAPVSARVTIYWQLGHSAGIDPNTGLSPLEIIAHNP